MDAYATQTIAALRGDRALGREGHRISLHNYVVSFLFCDVAILLGCGFGLAHLLATYRGAPADAADRGAWAIMLAVLFHMLGAKTLNLYSTALVLNFRTGLRRASFSLLYAFTMLIVIATATKTTDNYSRVWFFSWLAASFALIVSARFALVMRLRRALAQGAFVRKAISIGVFCEAISSEEIMRRSFNEVRVMSSARLNAIGELADFSDKIAQEEIDQLYVAVPWQDIPFVLQKLNLLRHLSTTVFVLPGDRRVCSEVAKVAKFGDRLSFCAIEESIHGWDLWLKRAEDLVIASAALVLLAPVMAAAALAIRLDSRGPIFFRQQRTGFNGRTFRLWKFRSMYAEMTDHHARTQTSPDDPRVTRVGRFIRRASIDELPQLFNVLEGTMSIVGPRPHALATKTVGQDLDELVDYYAVRHRVKPGITGWAQVNGFRGELDTVEKLQSRVDYDLYYIDNWTVWLDLKIVLKTAMLLLHDENAY